MLLKFVSAVFLEAFVLTFLGEWGDRSQLSTVLMAAHAVRAALAAPARAKHRNSVSSPTKIGHSIRHLGDAQGMSSSVN